MKLPLVTLATAVLCGLCGAFARDASSAPAPSFESLPLGEVRLVPRTRSAPASVGAGEHVAGFHLAAQHSQPGNGWVFLFGNAGDARQFATNNGAMPADASVCFTTADKAQMFAQPFLAPGEREPAQLEWPSWFESRPSLHFEPGARGQRSVPAVPNPVVAVHAERLVRGEAGHATLAMTDAWVDPRSRGVRLIGTSSLPLVRVATAPSGIEVYAARTKDGVQVVVTGSNVEASLDANARPFARQFSRLTAALDQGRQASSDCAHMRIALHPRGEGADEGPRMSVVQTAALLPPLEADETPGTGGVPLANPNPQVDAFKAVQAMRKRLLDIGVSATQTSSDATPVVSVAIGWAGPERVTFNEGID